MKPVLFSEDSTTYDSNGIGVLYDALRCEVYEEHNGAFDAELEYPVDGEWFSEIKEQRQFLAKPNDVDAPHSFRIYEIEKDLEAGTIIAKGTSVTNDLGGNLILNSSVKDVTAQQAMTDIKNNLIEPTIFDFVSDIDVISSSEWTRINPLQAIAGTDGSLVDLWGGDIKRTNNTIYLYSRRGTDKVTTIRPGKNIDGFNMVVSTKGIITKILPHYTYTKPVMPEYEMVEDYNGEMVKRVKYSDEEPVQQEEITVLGDVVVSDNASKYPVTYYSPVDYSQDRALNETVNTFIQARLQEAEESPVIIDNSNFQNELKQYVIDNLNQEAVKYFTHRNPDSDKPNVEIKVDMIQISDSPEWEKFKDLESIQVTDTVDVYVSKFNVDVEVTIKAIEYDSIGERVLTITAGSLRTSFTNSQEKTYVDATKELKEYINTLENGVYNSITKTADGQSRSFSGYTEPPHELSSEGDLWFKEVGDGMVEVFIYAGGVWVPKVSGEEVIERLKVLGIDARDVTIVNLDASSIVSGDLELTKGLRITNNGVPVMEIDATTGQVKITAPNLATQEDLEQIELTPGPEGKTAYEVAVDNGFVGTEQEWIDSLVGEPGINGLTAYEVAVNNGFVGTEQEWLDSLVGPQGPQGLQGVQGPEGEQGIQGPPGEDGISSYTHIAYATNSTGTTGFSTSDSTGALYIGMYVDSNPIDSEDPSLYHWTLIKGEDGSQGLQGPPGEDGKTPYFHIAYATSSDGSTGFSTTESDGKTYIGTYTDFIMNDSIDPTMYNWSLIKGEKGDTGPQGPQGETGIQGPPGEDGLSQYVHIRYSANSDGNPMSSTPQSNTVYIGLANTTSSTAPTSYSAYTWSLFKGADGSDGIQGPPGEDGQTTYTWVRYADDEYGGNMSDSPSGKRYIGLAFNKTTPTESDSASAYSWSPLYDNVKVGGRNLIETSRLIIDSGNTQEFVLSAWAKTLISNEDIIDILTPGETYTLSFDAELIEKTTAPTEFSLQVGFLLYSPTSNSISFYTAEMVNVGDRGRVAKTFVCPELTDHLLYVYTNRYTTDGVEPIGYDTIRFTNLQLENGNIATDWTPAPKDIEDALMDKASNTDMNNLAEIVSSMSAEVNLKAGMGELEAMEEAFNQRIEQDIADKEQLANDLSTLEGRMTLVETIAGDNKLVTQFINTVITESEEGIFIGNDTQSTGILLSDTRISFIDNDTEVAYISNQTMQISHGIFVESATISSFKFEKIPGTEILSITWVGD